MFLIVVNNVLGLSLQLFINKEQESVNGVSAHSKYHVVGTTLNTVSSHTLVIHN